VALPVRVALLTEIISPYRIPVFNELAADARVELDVLFIKEVQYSLILASCLRCGGGNTRPSFVLGTIILLYGWRYYGVG
jgi:hypothetical protein